MPMQFPRMTTRRWMVAVAVVALLLGGIVGVYRLRRWHDGFVYRAQWHSRIVVTLRTRWRVAPNDPVPPRLIVYYRSLASKYQHAARYPWLPVEPDPPEPE
jgi:hypothetical protein